MSIHLLGHFSDRLSVVSVGAEPHKGYVAKRVQSSVLKCQRLCSRTWKIWSPDWPAPSKDTPEVLSLYLSWSNMRKRSEPTVCKTCLPEYITSKPMDVYSVSRWELKEEEEIFTAISSLNLKTKFSIPFFHLVLRWMHYFIKVLLVAITGAAMTAAAAIATAAWSSSSSSSISG